MHYKKYILFFLCILSLEQLFPLQILAAQEVVAAEGWGIKDIWLGVGELCVGGGLMVVGAMIALTIIIASAELYENMSSKIFNSMLLMACKKNWLKVVRFLMNRLDKKNNTHNWKDSKAIIIMHCCNKQ